MRLLPSRSTRPPDHSCSPPPPAWRTCGSGNRAPSPSTQLRRKDIAAGGEQARARAVHLHFARRARQLERERRRVRHHLAQRPQPHADDHDAAAAGMPNCGLHHGLSDRNSCIAPVLTASARPASHPGAARRSLTYAGATTAESCRAPLCARLFGRPPLDASADSTCELVDGGRDGRAHGTAEGVRI